MNWLYRKLKCLRCGYGTKDIWMCRIERRPKMCPSCHSMKWDEKKKEVHGGRGMWKKKDIVKMMNPDFFSKGSRIDGSDVQSPLGIEEEMSSEGRRILKMKNKKKGAGK